MLRSLASQPSLKWHMGTRPDDGKGAMLPPMTPTRRERRFGYLIAVLSIHSSCYGLTPYSTEPGRIQDMFARQNITWVPAGRLDDIVLRKLSQRAGSYCCEASCWWQQIRTQALEIRGHPSRQAGRRAGRHAGRQGPPLLAGARDIARSPKIHKGRIVTCDL